MFDVCYHKQVNQQLLDAAESLAVARSVSQAHQVCVYIEDDNVSESV